MKVVEGGPGGDYKMTNFWLKNLFIKFKMHLNNKVGAPCEIFDHLKYPPTNIFPKTLMAPSWTFN